MSSPAVIAIKRLGRGLAFVAAGLAAVAGTIDAVDWGVHTFGVLPVAVVGGAALSAVVTNAIDAGMTARDGHRSSRRPS